MDCADEVDLTEFTMFANRLCHVPVLSSKMPIFLLCLHGMTEGMSKVEQFD